MKQTVIICGVVALIVSLSTTWLTRSKVIVEKRIETRTEEGKSLGATPGAVVDSKYFSIGGVERYYETQTMSASSSVLCFFKSPFTSTSTLISWSARVTRGVTGTNTFDLSTTSDAFKFGSSTPALIYGRTILSALASNASTSWATAWQSNSASTTAAGDGSELAVFGKVLQGTKKDGSSNILINPSDYLTMRIATTSGSVLADQFLGTCSAVFEKI